MKHLGHYVMLSVILGIGLALFYAARPNVTQQVIIGVCTTVAYIIWGIVHHALVGDLHPKIVIEYVLIGAIADVLLVTMLGF